MPLLPIRNLDHLHLRGRAFVSVGLAKPIAKALLAVTTVCVYFIFYFFFLMSAPSGENGLLEEAAPTTPGKKFYDRALANPTWKGHSERTRTCTLFKDFFDFLP
jgi:hypothetical protein